jgi:hypothetical protein
MSSNFKFQLCKDKTHSHEPLLVSLSEWRQDDNTYTTAVVVGGRIWVESEKNLLEKAAAVTGKRLSGDEPKRCGTPPKQASFMQVLPNKFRLRRSLSDVEEPF